VGLARLEPLGRLVYLAPEESGRIKRIHVEAGRHARGGDTIAVLDNAVELYRYRQALQNYDAQEAQVAAARADFASAQASARNAGTSADRLENLFGQGAATRQAYDDARTEAATARQRMLQLRAGLVSAQRQLDQFRSALGAARAAFSRRFIVAPTGGTMLSVDLPAGAMAGPQTPLGVFAPDGPPMALTEIDELFQLCVNVGQRAYIRRQGADETLSVGKVVFVAPFLRRKSLFSDQAGEFEDRRVREVHVVVRPAAGLVYGSRVETVVFVNKQ
jgi:multidrug resistance efflux pump